MSTALHGEAAWVCSRNLQTTSNGSPIARFLQRILENCCCMLLLYDSAPDEKITVSMVDLSDLDVDHLSTRGFWDLSAEVLRESSKRWSLLFCTQLREKLTTSMTIESASINVESCLRMQAFLKSPIAVHSIIPSLIPDDFYLLWLLKLSVCNVSVCSSISKKVTAPPPSWLQWSPGHGKTQTVCYFFLLDYHGLSIYFVEFVFFYIMFWTKIHRMTVLGTRPQQKQAVFHGRRHCCALVAVTIAEAIGKARCVEGLRGDAMDRYGEYRSFQQNEYHAKRLAPLKSPKYPKIPKTYNLPVVGM